MILLIFFFYLEHLSNGAVTKYAVSRSVCTVKPPMNSRTEVVGNIKNREVGAKSIFNIQFCPWAFCD